MVNKAGVGRLDVDRVGVRRCATDVVLSSWFGGGGVRRRVDVASSWRGGVLRRVEVLGVMRIDLVEVSSAFTGGTRVGVLRNLLAVVVVDRGGVLRNPFCACRFEACSARSAMTINVFISPVMAACCR